MKLGGLLLLLCTAIWCAVTTRAQVINWDDYCEKSSNSSVASALTSFAGKASRFKSAATDADSQIFKGMVKGNDFSSAKLNEYARRVAIYTVPSIILLVLILVYSTPHLCCVRCRGKGRCWKTKEFERYSKCERFTPVTVYAILALFNVIFAIVCLATIQNLFCSTFQFLNSFRDLTDTTSAFASKSVSILQPLGGVKTSMAQYNRYVSEAAYGGAYPCTALINHNVEVFKLADTYKKHDVCLGKTPTEMFWTPQQWSTKWPREHTGAKAGDFGDDKTWARASPTLKYENSTTVGSVTACRHMCEQRDWCDAFSYKPGFNRRTLEDLNKLCQLFAKPVSAPTKVGNVFSYKRQLVVNAKASTKKELSSVCSKTKTGTSYFSTRAELTKVHTGNFGTTIEVARRSVSELEAWSKDSMKTLYKTVDSNVRQAMDWIWISTIVFAATFLAFCSGIVAVIAYFTKCEADDKVADCCLGLSWWTTLGAAIVLILFHGVLWPIIIGFGDACGVMTDLEANAAAYAPIMESGDVGDELAKYKKEVAVAALTAFGECLKGRANNISSGAWKLDSLHQTFKKMNQVAADFDISTTSAIVDHGKSRRGCTKPTSTTTTTTTTTTPADTVTTGKPTTTTTAKPYINCLNDLFKDLPACKTSTTRTTTTSTVTFPPSKTFTAEVKAYPGFKGLSPSGTLTITPNGDGSGVRISGKVTGLAKSLAKAGISVHSGTDCSGGSDPKKYDAVIGGPYLFKGDGWLVTTYDSDSSGVAKIDIAAPAKAYTLRKTTPANSAAPEVQDRCIVIHGADGATDADKSRRVGIGKIVCDKTSCKATIKAYPAFTSSKIVPAGELVVSETGDVVRIQGKVTGLRKSTLKLGIHVHAGKDCTGGGHTATDKVNAVIGGHLLSPSINGWAFPTATTYDTDALGSASVKVDAVSYKLSPPADATQPAVEGHCVVLHGAAADKMGTRVAVARIRNPTKTTTTTTTTTVKARETHELYEIQINRLLSEMGYEVSHIQSQQLTYKNLLKDVVKPYLAQTPKNPEAECDKMRNTFFSMYNQICENAHSQAMIVFAMCALVAIFSIPMLWMSICMHERLFGNLIGGCCTCQNNQISPNSYQY